MPNKVFPYPYFSPAYKSTEKYQRYISDKITPQTRNRLSLLVKGMLNPSEIFKTGGAMPRADEAYAEFNDYYQSLSYEERAALNDYRIKSWSFMLFPGLRGMSSTTFSILYESMDQNCAHSVAGSLIQMLLQLDPNTQFDCSECPIMAYIVSTLKFRNPR